MSTTAMAYADVEEESKKTEQLQALLTECTATLKKAVVTMENCQKQETLINQSINALVTETARDMHRVKNRLSIFEDSLYNRRTLNTTVQRAENKAVRDITQHVLSDVASPSALSNLEEDVAELDTKMMTIIGAIKKKKDGSNLGELSDQMTDMHYRSQYIDKMLNECASRFHMADGKTELNRVLVSVEGVLSFLCKTKESGMEIEAEKMLENVSEIRSKMEKPQSAPQGTLAAKVATHTGKIVELRPQENAQRMTLTSGGSNAESQQSASAMTIEY